MTETAQELGPMPDTIHCWHGQAPLRHIGTWATTRYPVDSVHYTRTSTLPVAHKPNEDLSTAMLAIATEQADEIERLTVEIERLREWLKMVHQYGSDTLGGPSCPKDDTRDWQRSGVEEMTARARAALGEKT